MNSNIFIKNIYYMLSYVYGFLKKDIYQNIDLEKFNNINELLSVIIIKHIEHQIKNGLYKDYINIEENINVMRGKIKTLQTIKNKTFGRNKFFCEYDELTSNNLYNQIIKTALIHLLSCSDVSHEYKKKFKKYILFLSRVQTINPSSIDWIKIKFNRYNSHYYTIINICKLIFDSLIMTTETGENKLETYISNKKLHSLYEKFILCYYKKEFKNIETKSQKINWALDDENVYLLPKMQSDIILKNNNKILIIDAKYYNKNMSRRYGVDKIYSNNLYQIFTYVKNKNYEINSSGCMVSGLILYATTNDIVQPNVNYAMSGNKISIRTLNLGVEFHNIKEQLDYIVYEFCM